MDHGSSLFTYLEVPKECESVLSFLDVKLPQFCRLIKKIMRKIEKGNTQVCRPLKQMNEDGEVVSSGFEVVGILDTEPRDLLLACLPSANGTTELYRFPFVRLVVRKISDEFTDDTQSSVNPPECTLKSISDRLDQLSSSLAELAAQKVPKPRASRAATLPKPLTKEAIVKSSSTVGKIAAPETRPKSKSLDLKSVKTSESLAQRGYSQTPFADHLDNTIDDVLSCIRRGKDEQIFDKLKSKLYNNLDALPPSSAQVVDHTTDSVQHSISSDQLTPKKSRKRVLSPVAPNQSNNSGAPSPTKMRFTPITGQLSLNGNRQDEHGSPELLSLTVPNKEDELNNILDALARKEAQTDARREAKHKSVRSKRNRRQGGNQAAPQDEYSFDYS